MMITTGDTHIRNALIGLILSIIFGAGSLTYLMMQAPLYSIALGTLAIWTKMMSKMSEDSIGG